MTAIAADPSDKLAERTLSRDPVYNSTLRTTCVATLIEGGHAQNALPQRARANVNCRIAPGETAETTRAALARVVDDPGVAITVRPGRGPDSIYMSAVGIPSYGVPGMLHEGDGGGVHGLNEHMRVSSLYKGRDYLDRLIRIYGDAPGR